MSNQSVPPDVLKMIEEKRLKAIELRKRKLEEQQNQNLNARPNNGIVTNKSQSTSNSGSTFATSVHNSAFMNNYSSVPKGPILNVPSSSSSSRSATAGAQFPSQENAFTHLKTKALAKWPSPKKNASSSSQIIAKPSVKVSITLISTNRFSIHSEYNSQLNSIFKTIDSKRWDPDSKKWSFLIKDFENILSQMKKLDLKLEFIDSIPEAVINTLIESQSKKEDVNLEDRLSKEFIDGLYDFQREGIIFGIQRNGKCLIADDMGLGKTVQAIGLALWFSEDWPLIIVCPSSLRYQWMNSILRWAPNVSQDDIFIAKNIKDMFPRVPVTITSYDIMSRMKNRFLVDTNRFYNMIIMDESHYIKSDITQRTSTALLIAKSCRRVVLLSGTPALSRPIGKFIFPKYVLNLL